MKIKKQLATLRLFAIAILMLLPSFVSFGVFQPPTASAAACNRADYFQGGGGGGGNVNLSATVEGVDSSVGKLTSEFTPSQAWGASSRFYGGFGEFVKADCSQSDVSMNYSIEGTTLFVNFSDSSSSTSMQAGTDYDNLVSNADFHSYTYESSRSAYIAYTVGSITSGTAQQLSVDLDTNPGWADVYLKQGTSAEILLISFKLPADTTSFGSTGGVLSKMVYGDEGFYGTSCSDITGSKEVKVRMLADGVAVDLIAAPYTSATCGNYDKTTYDTGTKTASLKYDTAGETPRGTFSDGYAENQNMLGTDKNVDTNWYTSLKTQRYQSGEDTTYNMVDWLQYSNSASQTAYLVLRSYDDGYKNIPKDESYPLIRGVFDFSSGSDISLADKGVKIDTSAKQYASMAHNVGKVTKDGKFSLFVLQRKGDKNVGVCPGATKLSDVKLTCKDVYLLSDGQTANGATASLVTVGTNTFWRVDGLTGTGIFSSNVSEIPGAPDTGLEFLQSRPGVIALVSITGAGAIYLAKRRFVRVLGR